MKIGFIGCGNMARAMISGIIKGGITAAEDIFVSAHSTASVDKAKNDFGVRGCFDNRTVAENSDIIIYAVKPQVYEEVIRETADRITQRKIVISIAPGKTLEWLGALLPKGARIARCMPNTPALVGEGATAVCVNSNVTGDDKANIMAILESFGKAYELKESMMDGFIAVSGSSPAYIFMLIDAMADGAVMGGVPRAQAIELAAQAVLGSARMVLDTGMHPAQLKDMVCSPAGTTIEAVKALEDGGFRSAIINAEKACMEKSGKM